MGHVFSLQNMRKQHASLVARLEGELSQQQQDLKAEQQRALDDLRHNLVVRLCFFWCSAIFCLKDMIFCAKFPQSVRNYQKPKNTYYALAKLFVL